MKRLLVIFLILQHDISVYASAYLPEVGKYKISFSATTTDAMSEKKRLGRVEDFAKIQALLYALGEQRAMILQRVETAGRAFLNSEIRELEKISAAMNKLTKAAYDLNSFNEDDTAYFNIEYGANEDQSFGLNIGYTLGHFAEMHNNDFNSNVTNASKDIEAFYKHRLFQDDKLIVTFKPAIGCFSYNDQPAYKVDLGVLFGYMQKKKKFDIFHEFNILARQNFRKNTNTHLGYGMSFLEGVKFQNGITLSSYTEFQRGHASNFIYNSMIYEQISVAKDFYFGRPKGQPLTAQLGYFWKTSMKKGIYAISGPVFSLWCTL
jgi:hypothetical protein